MKALLNPNNTFFRLMNKLADVIILNLLCIICCIPIITIGPAITAMFYVTLKIVRNEETYVVKGFFHSFKDNFKQGILIHIIMMLIAAIIVFDMYFCWHLQANFLPGKILFGIFSAVAVVYVMVFIYIYPLLAKFSNTTKNLFLNALLMSIRHLPYTLAIIVITVIPFALMALNQTFLDWGILLFALLGFSGLANITSYLFMKIFDHYIPQAEANTERPEVSEEVEGSVFKNLHPTTASEAEETTEEPTSES